MHAPAQRLDWRAIKDNIDIVRVVVSLLGEPVRNRSWRCPFHDDHNPSFSVDPVRRTWTCWAGCGSGDAVALIQKLNPAMGFPEAVRVVAELSGLFAPSEGTTRAVVAPRRSEAPERPRDERGGLPPDDALRIVSEAAERLWTPEGVQALSYLHGRGLTDGTIRRARLGYVHSLSVPTKDGDRSYRVSGVTIPWLNAERLAKINVRRLADGDQARKYIEAFRDRPRVFPSLASIRPGLPLVIVEGEFDALLMHQEIGDRASVITLGSASGKVDPAVLALATCCPRWYVAHDADEAGDRAAARWPSRAVRVRPPEPCKDWNEAHASGPNRIKYVWGRYLPLGSPPKPEDFSEPVAGLSDDEPDDYAIAEREALQDPRTH